MPRPLSMDLRERIADAVNAGLSRSAAARRFAVAPSSAIKLMQAQAQTGTLAPKKMGGYRMAILAPHEATVRALVEETPDATLEELRVALRKQKIKVGRSALSSFLAKLRFTVKKNAVRQRTRQTRCG
jgi:transposase